MVNALLTLKKKVYTEYVRNFQCDALILNVTRQGENNRNVCLLSPEHGIFNATLFGGAKSRFRSLVSPFNRGTAYLYKDETKHTCKLTDFDVKKYHPSFRENLYKSYAASFASELAVRTKGSGSYKDAFTLINGFLDGMELSSENESRLGTLRFIWRYLGIMGIRPSVSECCQCGRSFISGKLEENAVLCKGAYSEADNGFICDECTSMDGKMYVLDKKALTYLEATASLSPAQVRNISIDGQVMTQLRQFCFYIIQFACGSRLKSIESGLGIL